MLPTILLILHFEELLRRLVQATHPVFLRPALFLHESDSVRLSDFTVNLLAIIGQANALS